MTKPFEIRGVMLDPARLMERHEFYFNLLDRLPRWGLNTLWWHFSDDQGFGLQLNCRPELATQHAFTRAQMIRFLAMAADRGIDVVPEFEALGHTRCITGHRKWADLANGDELGFNAICPSHPRTLPLLAEIITELAGLFPSRYFHAGMDEVNLGDCPRCRRAARGRPRWWMYAQHLKAVHAVVRSSGKEMIVWADHIEHDPELLDVLPKDLILAHWQYTKLDPAAIRRSLSEGFRVIGCPALCHWGNVILPHWENFANTMAMAGVLAGLPRPKQVLGMVNTWWTSWRGLRDAYLPAIAYTGAKLNGLADDAAQYPARFAREFWGLTAATAKRVGQAMWELYQLAPNRQELSTMLFDSPLDMHDALNLHDHADFAGRLERVEQATVELEQAERKVARNQDEYAATRLAGGVMLHGLRRCRRLAQAAQAYRLAEFKFAHGHGFADLRLPLEQALAGLADMRAADKEILACVEQMWDRTRYRDDPKKGTGADSRYSSDALLLRLARAEEFSRRMVDTLKAGIAECRRGGRFPYGF